MPAYLGLPPTGLLLPSGLPLHSLLICRQFETTHQTTLCCPDWITYATHCHGFPPTLPSLPTAQTAPCPSRNRIWRTTRNKNRKKKTDCPLPPPIPLTGWLFIVDILPWLPTLPHLTQPGLPFPTSHHLPTGTCAYLAFGFVLPAYLPPCGHCALCSGPHPCMPLPILWFCGLFPMQFPTHPRCRLCYLPGHRTWLLPQDSPAQFPHPPGLGHYLLQFLRMDDTQFPLLLLPPHVLNWAAGLADTWCCICSLVVGLRPGPGIALLCYRRGVTCHHTWNYPTMPPTPLGLLHLLPTYRPGRTPTHTHRTVLDRDMPLFTVDLLHLPHHQPPLPYLPPPPPPCLLLAPATPTTTCPTTCHHSFSHLTHQAQLPLPRPMHSYPHVVASWTQATMPVLSPI